MKKIIAFLLIVATLVCGLVGCTTPTTPENPGVDPNAKSEGVMTYAEYDAAELKSAVVIEAFVQAKQGWWADKATVYLQDGNGGYLAYNMACSEADYAKLTLGAKIKVTGTKDVWEGEVEIVDATFELAGNDTWVATAADMTAVLGTDDLIKNQNKLVSFKGMKIEASKDADGNDVAFLRNWDGSGAEGDDSDLYFKASVNGATYTFVIEYYLTGADSDAYKAVEALKVGDTVDMEGFLYWYNGSQPHINKVTVK